MDPPTHANGTEPPGQPLHQNVANGSSAPPAPQQPPTADPTILRRPSHSTNSPLGPSSRPGSTLQVRRSSSAMSMNQQRGTPSPKPMRRTSRSSLGTPQPGDDDKNNRNKKPTPKRSISSLITNLKEAQSTMEAIEEPVPLTAAGIATEHFARELAAHEQAEAGGAETMVLMHDACYGHRWSRLKTTKSTLAMIVERPERLQASALGASLAYVRMGEHFEGARNAPRPGGREVARPPFQTRRTRRALDVTSSYVTNVHGASWMGELKGMCGKAGERIAAGAKELVRSDTLNGEERQHLHESDLYLCAESLNAFEGALGGVADAVDAVFGPAGETKRAFVAVRPPGHHCSADHPSGFCWLNNVHVGIEYAAQTFGLTHAAILDFDLHHGDGSQAITWERNSKNNIKRINSKPNSKVKIGPDIGYYSLHDINSYPCEMGDDEKVQAASLCIENAHGQNVWNVHLQTWKTEDEFWQLYETRYLVLLDKARAFLKHHTARLKREGKFSPRAAIFISAGFDASEWEGSGMQRHKVNVPTEFYARFTRDMVKLAQEEDSGCEGRVISVLEGGYSDRALCSGVLSHLSGLCATPPGEEGPKSGPADLDQMMESLGINETPSSNPLRYDKTWWSEENLIALETQVNPPPPPQAKKMRNGPQPTYATPTESFAYKVVDTNKFARSISGTMREGVTSANPHAPPPPPEVDWVTATQELSKLLIPTDRQVRSCLAEELAGPRTKKERQSAMPVLTSEESAKPRELRTRKGKAAAYPDTANADPESMRSESRNSRRQTIADLPSASDEPESSSQQTRASRRLSAGSALSVFTGDMDSDAPPVPSLPSAASTTDGSMKPPPVPGQGVQVKKTRAPAKPAKKAAAPVSAPVSPTAPRKSSSAVPTPPNGTTGSNAPSGSSNPPGNDVDALASGLKRVTLKLGSREDHDRKQKERLDAERRARAQKGAETRKANAAARLAATGSSAAPVKSAKGSAQKPGAGSKENKTPTPAEASAITPATTSDYFDPNRVLTEAFVPPPASEARSTPASDALPTPQPPQPPRPQSPAVFSTQEPPQSSAPDQARSSQPLPPAGPTPESTPPAPQHPSATPTSTSGPDSAARQLMHENEFAASRPSTASAPQPPRPQHAHTQLQEHAHAHPPLHQPQHAPHPPPQPPHHLPVWSSTSTIPFAPATASTTSQPQPPPPNPSSSSPHPTDPPSAAPPHAAEQNPVTAPRNPSSRPVTGFGGAEGATPAATGPFKAAGAGAHTDTETDAEAPPKPEEVGQSIWDVPATPEGAD